MKVHREHEMKGFAIGRLGQAFIKVMLNQVALSMIAKVRRTVLSRG